MALKRYSLDLIGHVPAKKNLWKRMRGGRVYLNAEAQACIDALIGQARTQWGRAKPLSRPTVSVRLWVADQRGDLDNKYTTLQDVLVKAGVIVNDNVKHLRGPVTFAGEVGKPERCVIELEVGDGR